MRRDGKRSAKVCARRMPFFDCVFFPHIDISIDSKFEWGVSPRARRCVEHLGEDVEDVGVEFWERINIAECV